MPKPSGYTLIELLVVLTIIATLSTIGFVTYTAFLKNARDSRRQADLKFIQSALEQYHGDQKHYPAGLDFGDRLTNATGVTPAPVVSKIYLNSVPIGPLGVAEYLYKAFKADNSQCIASEAISCSKYCLYAKAENISQVESLCPDQVGFNMEVTSP